MNAEDLNDICGRAVRGAPIDADHVLEIIADLTAAEARLKAEPSGSAWRATAQTRERQLIAAQDECARWADHAENAEAAIARVRELCDETDGPSTVRKDVILAAIEGNQP